MYIAIDICNNSNCSFCLSTKMFSVELLWLVLNYTSLCSNDINKSTTQCAVSHAQRRQLGNSFMRKSCNTFSDNFRILLPVK